MRSKAAEIIYGCMGLGGGWDSNPVSAEDIKQANDLIDTAIESGIRVFDHADIYTFGKAEQVFGMVLSDRPELRDQITIQTKCGIRFEDDKGPKRYDFSGQWIEDSVNKSLERLQTECIDTLLLHRPDALADMEEVSATFNKLFQSGKVKRFGVSNMHRHQLSVLGEACSRPISVNQLELSLLRPNIISDGLFFNTLDQTQCEGTLEYCYAKGIKVQAWSSLARGKLTGGQTDTPEQHATAALVGNLAHEYGVSKEAILVAWLMAHPMGIQPVLGTTNISRLKNCMQAAEVKLSREHWYSLLVTILGRELP